MSVGLAAAIAAACLTAVGYGRRRGWITFSEFGWMTVGLCVDTTVESARRDDVEVAVIFGTMAVVSAVMLMRLRVKTTS